MQHVQDVDPLRRGELAPPPRTLVDVFRATVEQADDEPAVDAGNDVLTYAELAEAADELAVELNAHGVGRGGKVGVRVNSGTTDLYVAILAILLSGAAYVPVDVDDPDERARLVFDEADVAAIVGNDRTVVMRREGQPREPEEPGLDDDAWVIFTSGSTGTPKGVAVTHRSAAAFVDAESRLFLQDAPLGVGDRVMAGLSVAFDASCEEMWLAWRYGGCLVPAPRALVKSGIDVGPWLVANDINVVSTVPTLVALWPFESLAGLRLLIMGGEAVPPELATRLVAPGREVWNTYGPTEATVVACGALLTGEGPVRIGLPLDGWDLAVVDGAGQPVAEDQTGELIIGGVGLARYLDPAKDAEKYAAMPSLGWPRAYRSGDLVVNDPAGLLFAGRADDQVKLGGRRIELGEIDSALLAVPGVVGAAAAVRRSGAGNQLLVGYVATDPSADPAFDHAQAMELLRHSLPAALVPRLAQVDVLPTKTSGKVDRDALPWPLPSAAEPPEERGLEGTMAWIAELWLEVLGADVRTASDDFFDLGGGSLTAAQMVSRLRTRFPEVAVGDLYEHPTVGTLGAYLDGLTVADPASDRTVPPTPLKTQAGQVVATLLVRVLAGPRWLVWIGIGSRLLADALGWTLLPRAPWLLLVLGWLVFVTPPGRMLLAAAGVRLLLRNVEAGDHPRGGHVHLRLWLAQRVVDQLGATGLAGAPYMTWFARLLGAKIGRDVDLHSIPPVTGLLRLGSGASIEPEVDLSGFWVDGDVVHLGPVRVGARARVGARSMLCPGADVGKDAEVAPGSAVFGSVPDGEYWSGSPAVRIQKRARGPWSDRPSATRTWIVAYGVVAVLLSCLPILAVLAGAALPVLLAADPTSYADLLPLLAWLPVSALIGLFVLCPAGVARGPRGRPVGAARRAPRAQRRGPGRLDDDAGPRRRPDLALPPLRLEPDADLAPAARRPDREGRGGLDGADGAQSHPGQRPVVPGRRHPARRLRARRRMDAGRAGQDRQARVRRQLRDGRARPTGPQVVPGRGAFRGAAAQVRARGGVVAGQPAGHPPAYRCRQRRGPHLQPADSPQGGPRARGGLPDIAGRGRRRAGGVGGHHAGLAARPPVRRRAGPGPRGAAARRGRPGRRAGHRRRQVAAGGPAAPGRVSAVELVRLAQRAGRHLRRGGGGTLVRPQRRGHAAAQRVVPADGREDRTWGVVRDVLAARDRPGRAR